MRGGPLDVAIVGMACRFPGANDLCSFWENILAGKDAISDVPADRWDPAIFFDADSPENDRVSCRRGGYLKSPIELDSTSWGVAPSAIDGSEPEQFLILDAARMRPCGRWIPDWRNRWPPRRGRDRPRKLL